MKWWASYVSFSGRRMLPNSFNRKCGFVFRGSGKSGWRTNLDSRNSVVLIFHRAIEPEPGAGTPGIDANTPVVFAATVWSEPVSGGKLHTLNSGAFHGGLFRQLSSSAVQQVFDGRSTVRAIGRWIRPCELAFPSLAAPWTSRPVDQCARN